MLQDFRDTPKKKMLKALKISRERVPDKQNSRNAAPAKATQWISR